MIPVKWTQFLQLSLIICYVNYLLEYAKRMEKNTKRHIYVACYVASNAILNVKNNYGISFISGYEFCKTREMS